MQRVNTMLRYIATGLIGLLIFQQGLAQPKMSASRNKAMIERGRWMVNLGGCNDCHTPKIFGPKGPILDTTRLLSGAPASAKLPEIPQGVIAPDKWGALTTNDLTTWAGPWGVSFTRNLTPDVSTGLGSWTEAIFIKAIRTGKDMGEGRDILPPMPWEFYAKLSDGDLKSIFAYLKSLPPIENAVPDPISPAGERLPTLHKPKN